MEDMQIWEISAAATAPVIVAAGFDSETIQAWDVVSRVKISEFDTIFLWGTRNLAVTPDGKYAVVGRCKRRGMVAAYDIAKASLLWKLENVVFPSFVSISVSGQLAWCETGGASSRVDFFDVNSGSKRTSIKRAEKFKDSSYGVSLLTMADKEVPHQMQGAATKSFPQMESVMDVSFMPDALCITEVCTPVRCISYAEGEERWRFQRPGHSHVYRLYWSSRLQAVFGVELGLETGKTFRKLIRLEADTGKLTDLCVLRSRHTEAFIPATDQLITSDGDLIDLATGVQVDRLEFYRSGPGLG